MPCPGDPANSVYVSLGLDVNAGTRPGPSGCADTYIANYESIAEWQTARLRNLVSLDETEILECYNDWPSGLLCGTDINGWTTGSGNRVIIRAAEGQKPTNIATDGFHLKSGASTRVIRLRSDYIELHNIGILLVATNTAYEAIAGDGEYGGVIGCFVTGTLPGGRMIRPQWHRWSIINNFIYSVPSYEAQYGLESSHLVYCYNNTIRGHQRGIICTRSDSQAYFKNNAVFDNSVADYDLNPNNTGVTNATSDGTGIGNVYTISNPAAEFVEPMGTDLHLLEGSGLRGIGTDLSADSNRAFDDDIDLETRSAWDIGGDEFTSGPPPVTPPAGNAIIHGTNF